MNYCTLPKLLKLCIFDLDGTILNSEPIHIEAYKQAIEKHNSSLSQEELERFVTGFPDKVISQNLINHLNLECSVNNLMAQKEEIVIDLISHTDIKTILTNGFVLILDLLEEQEIPIAIVSASQKKYVEKVQQELEKLGHSIAVFDNSNTFLPKPSASPYLNAMRFFKTKGEETLIFEDSETGLTAARATGSYVVRITGHSKYENTGKWDQTDFTTFLEAIR